MKKFAAVVILIGAGAAYWEHLKKKPQYQKLHIVFGIDRVLARIEPADKISFDDDCKGDYHISNGNRNVYTRPHYRILNAMHKIADVSIFTSLREYQANEILLRMYPEDIFKKKLYRDSCRNREYHHDGKDLLLIDGNLANTILVDDKRKDRYDLTQRFYHIPEYTIGNRFDIALLKVFAFVIYEYIKDDIRHLVPHYRK